MYLAIIGFDEIVSIKYADLFFDAIEAGTLDGYYIVDLRSQEASITKRLEAMRIRPVSVIYLKDDGWEEDFERKFGAICQQKQFRVYIAAEAKAHFYYLQWCILNGISVLVEKPAFVSMRDGVFAPEELMADTQRLAELAERNHVQVSVMTTARYHKVFNEVLFRNIGAVVQTYHTPITSMHIRHAGGVWNLGDEYDTREDHPYKYGYGMIMHGGYHYIDLLSQAIEMNRQVLNTEMAIELTAFSARPSDQSRRISREVEASVGSDVQVRLQKGRMDYGETDITATFRLYEKEGNSTITIGTIALEQTTPSVRGWAQLPSDVYNKNGRKMSLDFELQVSTLASEHIVCVDTPSSYYQTVADLLSRYNARIMKDATYVSKRSFIRVSHSNSNRELIRHWIRGEETRSQLRQHITCMKLVYLLSMASKYPGKVFGIDI